MSAMTVDVTWTDRLRVPDGHYRTGWTRVVVLAGSGDEAALVATQMVLAIRTDIHPMVLDAIVCI